VRGRPNAKLRAEVLARRHQLRVLERQVARPRWQPTDCLLLAAISRALPGQPGDRSCPARRRCSAGIGSWSAANGPPTGDALADWDRFPGASSTTSSFDWPGRTPAGGTAASRAAAEAGLALLPSDRAQSSPPAWRATRAAARSALLARVRPSARRPDPGSRLLHRGHGLADSALRVVLDRGRHPARSPRRLHLPSGAGSGAWALANDSRLR